MYNYTINLNDALNIASIAPNGTGNTASIGLGLYNYVNYSVGIWGDFQAVINERGSNMQLVKEVYLCIDGSDDIGAFYVTGFSTPFYCDENYVYRIPLHGGMTQNGQVNVLISCPGATTFTQLNAVTAHFEVEEYPFTLSAQQRVGVFPLVNRILKKEHLLVTVQATVANGSSVNVEVTDYSLVPTLVQTGRTVQVERLTKTASVTLQNTTETFPSVSINNVAIYQDQTNSLQMDVAIPSSVQGTVNAVLTLHGGGWASGNREKYAHYEYIVLSNGLVYAGVDYSLITPSSNANNPNCNTMLGDIAQAISTLGTILENKGLTLGKVALMGYSAGGHLALLYGLKNPYNPADNSGISLIVAEGAPTYFTKYDLHNADFNCDKRDSIIISNYEHNQMATIIRILAGAGSDLSETIEPSCCEIRAISPADLPNNNKYEDFADAGGKILLAYAKKSDNATDDGLVLFNRGTAIKQKLINSSRLFEIKNCNHEQLATLINLIGTETVDDEDALTYLEKLDEVLSSYADDSSIDLY